MQSVQTVGRDSAIWPRLVTYFGSSCPWHWHCHCDAWVLTITLCTERLSEQVVLHLLWRPLCFQIWVRRSRTLWPAPGLTERVTPPWTARTTSPTPATGGQTASTGSPSCRGRCGVRGGRARGRAPLSPRVQGSSPWPTPMSCSAHHRTSAERRWVGTEATEIIYSERICNMISILKQTRFKEISHDITIN